MTKNGNKFLYLSSIMLNIIINFVKILSTSFLSNNLNTNECYIKSCLIYKYLFELYFRKNVTLYEVMTKMDITDFLFFTNSPVLKNHLIFHHAFKTFWKRHKKGRSDLYVFDTTIRSSVLGFVTGVLYWFFHEGVV